MVVRSEGGELRGGGWWVFQAETHAGAGKERTASGRASGRAGCDYHNHAPSSGSCFSRRTERYLRGGVDFCHPPLCIQHVDRTRAAAM